MSRGERSTYILDFGPLQVELLHQYLNARPRGVDKPNSLKRLGLEDAFLRLNMVRGRHDGVPRRRDRLRDFGRRGRNPLIVKAGGTGGHRGREKREGRGKKADGMELVQNFRNSPFFSFRPASSGEYEDRY